MATSSKSSADHIETPTTITVPDSHTSSSTPSDKEDTMNRPAETTSDAVVTDSNMPVLFGELTKRGFRFAPPEVRMMIFEKVFEDLPHEETHSFIGIERPALLKALKGDQQLHDEASAACYKVCTFRANWQNGRLVRNEGDISFEAIQKLDIFFEYHDTIECGGIGWRSVRRKTEPHESIKKILSQATNVTELGLYFVGGKRRPAEVESDLRIFEKIAMCLKSFPKLKKLTIEIVKNPRGLPHSRNFLALPLSALQQIFRPYVPGVVNAIDEGLGFKGVTGKPLCHPFDLTFTSVWAAKPRELLVWNVEAAQKVELSRRAKE